MRFNTTLKRILLIVICVLFVFLYVKAVYTDEFIEDEPILEVFSKKSAQGAETTPPKIEASAAVVMDMKSGRILYSKNADVRKPIASTTKIMTAIIAIENGNLDDKVKVSKRAASIWGSTIKLKAGEELTLRELLYGLMLRSGNDAAIAVAEHIGGTVENFVSMMNDKAKKLGLKNTAFVTPHGLDADGHYSTAAELAEITRYALKNPTFSKIVGTQNISIKDRNLYSTNEMLSLYQGADGVKTGYTGKAGRCLVTSATRDNFRIISVVLGCSSRETRAQSSKAILDYCFNNYKPYRILEENQEIAKIEVKKGKKRFVRVVAMDGLEMPMTFEERQNLVKEIEVCDILNAPVYKDIEAGVIKFSLNGKVVAQTTVKTSEDVPAKGFADYWNEITRIWYRLMKTDS